ncbi:MAG TPA: endonuclease/exonuclease/phosphatase family protein, partial [Gaiellaceae bacterium]|nr:endonuclease/exonuclease/phosphatase family protein [Gaiellaceae bacterium]
MKGAAVLLALLACIAASAGEARRSPVTITVMTRNLYLGTNLDAIIQAKSTHEAFSAVEQGWANVQANDFPTRARAIAKEIASARPDFVGFQELSLYRTQTPPDFTVTPATMVALDYAKELRKALAARKLRYHFLAIGNETDAELPSGDPPSMDIRLTIRDGLLVRIDKKIKIRRVRTGLYSTTTSLFGGFVTAKRGWVLADATVGGRTFRVITTHLESFNDTSQVAQGRELVAPGGPATTTLPTILLGDLNSRAD